ncbi:hypothetical protein [Micromonospora sp. KC213]|uniref:hypothetical protein n=1 Tax=Micromonospora sp. KC213 TaxID=2530378 RepID=UPI001048F79B|nr:hypothetical protein [Micromonospora sp. KC213]TDC33465.1 hypothetical protein E1166_25690 [Micromonospora sp. KC213]
MTTWRYIAQRAVTKEWLHWDVPLTLDDLSWALSGPGSLRGTVTPDVGQLRGADGLPLFDEWGTFLFAEADGEIRWGGIIIRSHFTGPDWQIEAAGFSAYPHGLPYGGAVSTTSIDPADAIREIWRYVQENEDGDLGVVIDPTTTPIRLGKPGEPYAINWWEATDCGGEIDALARETPIDYAEEHYWDGEEIAHRLRLGYPRLGRRRDDLAFEQGVNVVEVVEVDRDGGEFANAIHALGSGEGRKAVVTDIAERDGRLRRTFVYTDKSVTTRERLTAFARAELAARRNVAEIASVEVVNHPHAPIGSWALGDDVLIRASLPWLGDVAIWHRITGWSLVSDDRAVLDLRRSDAFTYGGAVA